MSPERWQILEDLFNQAMDLPAGDERDRFVAERTAGDAELQQRLLELVREEESGVQKFDDIIGNVILATASAASQPPDAWIGRRIGSYRIVRELGRGGMGVVYEAERDDSEYQKKVAIKVAPEWLRSPAAIERFREERQILATLEHPGICRMLDGGTVDGAPYFVMELIEGVHLKQYCQGKTLRERLELFIRIGQAVSYAHERLIIHRDLKPGNILVTADGTPKLLDFGIATIAGLVSGQESERLLTPDYASPEQLRNQPVSTRTDVYALGLILYELLTGVKGQKADTSSAEALSRSVCDTVVPPPSTVHIEPDTHLPYPLQRLEGDLDAIVVKAVSKDPQHRYMSVAAIIEDLENYLAMRPVAARGADAWYKAAKYLRRNWLPVSMATVAILSLIGGIAAFAYQANIANERFNTVRKLATTILFDVHDNVYKLPGSTNVRSMLASTAAAQLESLSRNAGSHWALRRELAGAYLRLGTVQGVLGSSLGRMPESQASYESGLRQLDGMPAEERTQAAVVEGRLLAMHSMLLQQKGQGRDISPRLDRAAKLLETACLQGPAGHATDVACAAWSDTLIMVAENSFAFRRDADGARAIDRADREVHRLPTALERDIAKVRLSIQRNRWLFLQKRRAECFANLNATEPVARRIVETAPDDPSAIRTAANFGSMQACFAFDDVTRAERQRHIEMLRWSVDLIDRLIRRDPGDVRALFLRGTSESLIADELYYLDPKAAIPVAASAAEAILKSTAGSPYNRDGFALLLQAARTYITLNLHYGHHEDALAMARKLAPRDRTEGNATLSAAALELRARRFLANFAESLDPALRARLWGDVLQAAKALDASESAEAAAALGAYERYRQSISTGKK